MRNLVAAYVINQSIHWFIVGLFFPIMILFLLDRGLDIFEAGTAVAVYSATVITLELPTGGLSDSIGRKRVYMTSVAVQLITATIFLLAWNFPGLLLGVVSMGTARALSSGTIDAWFVDEFNLEHPGGDLQKVVARAQIFIPIGIAVGSLAGGAIPTVLGPWTADVLGKGIYASNILVMIVALIIQMGLTSVMIVERTGKGREGSVSEGLRRFPEVVSTSLRYGVKNRVVLMLMLASLALGFGSASVELLWQPRVKEIAGPDSGTIIFGVLAAAYFMASSLGNIAITPLCSRIRTSFASILTALRVLTGVALILLAAQGTIPLFALFFLLVLMLNGMSISPHMAIFNSQVPSERRSTMMSFESLISQIGVMIGAFVLGAIAQSASIPTAWSVAGAALVVSSAAYMVLVLWRFNLGRKPESTTTSQLISDESLG